ncbi:MAG: D-amino acid aminotransferase [Acidimicrobiaceae bacterium]|nr:D-amino acid aminotransferase [Acidimicrobiaceae bacterium]
MTRTVYLNGAFVDEAEAKVPIMDRGLLFADAVYEGIGVLDGRLVDGAKHLDRLGRSLAAVDIPAPMGRDELVAVLRELVARDGLDEGFLYLHVTRGVVERNYVHAGDLVPTVFAFTQAQHGVAADGESVVRTMRTFPDLRWARRDVKTTNLLGQVLAKQAAAEAGDDEALLVKGDAGDGAAEVTEGGAVSFFPVVDGRLLVRPLSPEILPGVTRSSVLPVAAAEGLAVEERTYTLAEALAADEAFITGASSYVEPVGAIDGVPVGDGAVGPLTRRLRAAYLADVRGRLL